MFVEYNQSRNQQQRYVNQGTYLFLWLAAGWLIVLRTVRPKSEKFIICEYITSRVWIYSMYSDAEYQNATIQLLSHQKQERRDHNYFASTRFAFQ